MNTVSAYAATHPIAEPVGAPLPTESEVPTATGLPTPPPAVASEVPLPFAPISRAEFGFNGSSGMVSLLRPHENSPLRLPEDRRSWLYNHSESLRETLNPRLFDNVPRNYVFPLTFNFLSDLQADRENTVSMNGLEDGLFADSTIRLGTDLTASYEPTVRLRNGQRTSNRWTLNYKHCPIFTITVDGWVFSHLYSCPINRRMTYLSNNNNYTNSEYSRKRLELLKPIAHVLKAILHQSAWQVLDDSKLVRYSSLTGDVGGPNLESTPLTPEFVNFFDSGKAWALHTSSGGFLTSQDSELRFV